MMNKVNILVVDDRPEGVLAVQAVLDSPGYNIVTASSGSEALKHLLRDDFAVILLDVQMPIMNGFETASVIKTREKSKDIPIIFMSAINQDEQYVYQGYGVGAIDYLLKPFDPYILRSKVAIFVDIYRKNILIREQAQKLRETEARSHAQRIDQLEIENLRRYQNLADSISQIVFRLLPDGHYEYFNKVWFEYTGLGIGSCLGMNWKDVIHPEDVDSLLSIFKEPYIDKSLECECRILNRKGEFRWHLIRVHPEYLASPDEIHSWLGTATDIEERKKAEETQKFLARAGESLVSTIDYRETLESIARLVIPSLADWCAFDIVDDKGGVENLVLNHKDPKRTDTARRFHDKYLCRRDSHFGSVEVITQGKTVFIDKITTEVIKAWDLESENSDLIEELRETQILIVPLILHKKILGALTLVSSDLMKKYDQTTVVMVEELARRVALAYENSSLYKLSQDAIEVRNEFLSIASHELNTPITSLKLQLQLVKKSLVSTNDKNFSVERFAKSVDASVKQVDRLINLIQILLDVSRIQSGKFTFNFEKFNTRELLDEVIDRHQEILSHSESTIEVTNSLDSEVLWDKTRIEQVLTNLLTNAIKYAPGKIELRIWDRGTEVGISVSDHGQGIQPEKIKTIFERFERATSDRSVSGLGLGLFIVKQIAEGHGGRVEVESSNSGTVFSVYLPREVNLRSLSEDQGESRFH